MITNEQNNFTFIAIPKTGTRSVCQVLQKHYDGKLFAKHEHVVDVPDVYKARYTFTTVRNPYRRICSAFWFALKDPKFLHQEWLQLMTSKNLDLTLENYLYTIRDCDSTQHHPGIQQSYYFKHIKYNKVLKLENLEEDFNSLPFVKNSTKLPKLNISFSKANVHEELLTPTVIKLVNEIYYEDFEMFGYERMGE